MLRAFVGCTLDPDAETRVREICAIVKARMAAAGGRATFTPPENLHVTLKFLGLIDDAQTDPLDRALADVAARHEAIRAHIAGLGAFPPKGPPRVIFAAIAEGHDLLASLARDIDAACVALGHSADARAFHAHITLARTKPGPRVPLERISPMPCDAGFTTLRSITLFRSDPGPRGAVYTALASHRLRETATT